LEELSRQPAVAPIFQLNRWQLDSQDPELEYELVPNAPQNLLYRHLLETLRGNPDEGRKILGKAAADGTRLLPE
jgi:hypothetical protein